MDIVSTKNGKVKGKVVELRNTKDGKPVHVFHRIPFAEPPTGNLRFMPPKPNKPWSDIIDGTLPGVRPMFQSAYMETMEKLMPMPIPKGEIKTQEDCLYLSVYTPELKTGKNLPVMVFLFGGGFIMGSEVDYDASVLAGLNDVVVVVPNYRVGVFGFLSLGKDSVCTGNAGILDQQMALKWVQENIESFGGDKTNVTIFGESAGGVSVHLNIISPKARGLFHKAISHSGQISMPALFNSENENKEVLQVVLNHFKINEMDGCKTLEALQAIPAAELIKVNGVLEQKRVQFAPMVDGCAFEKPAIQYLLEKEFPKIPYIIGCNSTEGSGLFGMFMGKDFITGISEEMARMGMPKPVSDEIWEKIKKFYETDGAGDDRFSKLLSNVFQDGMFAVPAMHDARIHSETGSSVYVYLGDFQMRMHHDDEYGKEVLKKPDFCVCDHGDDLFMTFGFPFSPNEHSYEVKYSKEEEILSRKWMTYFTNFAKTGDPNKGCGVEKQWPEFKQGELLVLSHDMKTTKNYRENEIKFWKDVIYGMKCAST